MQNGKQTLNDEVEDEADLLQPIHTQSHSSQTDELAFHPNAFRTEIISMNHLILP